MTLSADNSDKKGEGRLADRSPKTFRTESVVLSVIYAEPLFTGIEYGIPASEDYMMIEPLFAEYDQHYDFIKCKRRVPFHVNISNRCCSTCALTRAEHNDPETKLVRGVSVKDEDDNDIHDNVTAKIDSCKKHRDSTVLPDQILSYSHLLLTISERTARLASLRNLALYFSWGLETPSICYEDVYNISRWKKFTEGRPKTTVFRKGTIYTYDELPSFSQSKQKLSKKAVASSKGRNDKSVVVQPSDSMVTCSALNPLAPAFNGYFCNTKECPEVLKDLRIENVGNIIIAHLNINSLRYKFHSLVQIIGSNIDILVVGETKLDSTFPLKTSFIIEGFKKPYRRDRNGDGGGVIIYVRDDIPSQEKSHNLPHNVEAILVEINLRKMKFLLIGIYHSTNKDHGTTDDVFIQSIGEVLDKYSVYDKFIIAGDFNMREGCGCLDAFLDEFCAKNIVKEPTCYKNPDNPSCVDLFITNSHRSFMKTTALSTGLSDFHKMIVTVMRTTFPKAKPKVVKYRDMSKFDQNCFNQELQINLKDQPPDYDLFEKIFLRVLDFHAPQKTRLVRANQKPYVTNVMRKAIMRRTQLQNKYFKFRTQEHLEAFKRQKNYCNRLYKRERKQYYYNLNLNNITDNKKFWKTMKPLFSNKGGVKENIVLVEGDRIINEDAELAQTFNNFFDNAVKSLGITENKALLNVVEPSDDVVLDAIKMYESHPSILKIRECIVVDTNFSFSTVEIDVIQRELKNLNPKKGIPYMNIPAKQLKEAISVIDLPLLAIWNEQMVGKGVFPSRLKLADVTPIFKKLQSVLKENYRPVTVLPVVSKLFERIMDKQIAEHMEKFLSPYVCGYRSKHGPQLAMLIMIEMWKKIRNEGGIACGVLMDLSKAFDTINHKLLIAKLHAYGFNISALRLIWSYFDERWQRTKINNAFSPYSRVESGMGQGSVNGPRFFNYYINDFFFFMANVFICNMADDTTPYDCNMHLSDLFRNLEGDVAELIQWFDANYMILNQSKCHVLLSAPKDVVEQMYVRVGEYLIWESREEKLLGLTIDKELKFHTHIEYLCKNAGTKVTAMARLARVTPAGKKKILMKSFIESQFAYCSLTWMFCNRELNDKINRVHGRGLRLVYKDHSSTFNELLQKDKLVTIHQRNIHLLATEMFKIVKTLGLEIMNKLFKRNERSGSKNEFIRPIVNNNFGRNSIRSFGPIVWDDMLPEKLKSIVTIEKFKKEVKKWIPVCKCNLCKPYIQGVGYVDTFD